MKYIIFQHDFNVNDLTSLKIFGKKLNIGQIQKKDKNIGHKIKIFNYMTFIYIKIQVIVYI